MKIIQVPVRYYPHIGGVEQYVHCLSKEIVKLGHQVKVICANEPPEKSNIVEGVAVRRLKYIMKIANTNITLGLPFALLKENCDIIHNNLPVPWSADWATVISLIKRKPMILTYHNDIPEKGNYKFLTWIYNRTFLKFILKVSKVIIITQKNYINSSQFLKKFKNKIKVIPCGVDTEKFYYLNLQKKDNLKRIFFLSVLDDYHRYKGLDYLLKAFTKVVEKRKDVLLVVGGEGILCKEYKKEAEDLGISQYVNFVGRIPEEEMNRYFNECDVFVLPSVSSEQEGFGIVALEAMACAKPVVVTDIVGVAKEVKEHGTGRVVPPRDVEVLTCSIQEVLDNSILAIQMGKKGRELIEMKFSWEKIARDIEAIYKTLI